MSMSTSEAEVEAEAGKAPRRYKQRFRSQWLREPRLSRWLRPCAHDPGRAACRLCRCLLTAKLCDIDKHLLTAKHRKRELELHRAPAPPQPYVVEVKLLGDIAKPGTSKRACLNPLTDKHLQKLKTEFDQNPMNLLARNVCTKIDPYEACISRPNYENSQHIFEYKIETEGKPVTNQKTSGRCWIFAALNVMRLPFMKHHGLEEFEFSQGYLFFWDKIERCHYWLNSIVETARRGESVDGRLVSFLLGDPSCDGGQWDMLVNLINKHGVMPKKCFPESFSCESSQHMNAILISKLREYAKDIFDLIKSGADDGEIQIAINNQMSIIYNVVAICLSIPPEKFVWEYYTKAKAYKTIGPISPIDFYNTHVKPVFDVNDKVCLITDPRPKNEYGKLYTVDCLGNVVGGRQTLYNNQPVELLMKLAADSIKAGEAVWFGCEVNKRFANKLGLEDLEIHDFALVFGTDIQLTLSKANRMIYRESSMTHAMVFTAVSVDDEDVPVKFRVENSWGEERGEKGYLLLTADWFKEFVFEIVCDKKFVPEDILSVFEQEPIVLPAWDPMGTLANY